MASDAQKAAYAALKALFLRCFDQIQATDRNFQLAKFGVQQLSKVDIDHFPENLYPTKYFIYAGLWADWQKFSHQEKAREEIIADSKKEIDNDFPLLSASAATALWTALEDLVREFSTFWIITYPSKVTLNKPKKDLTIPMSDLLDLDASRERIAWALCQSIMGEKASEAAICRYDHLQKAMGLIFPAMPKSMRTVLIELEAVRHIIVHRSSVVDNRFKLRCPSPNDVPEAVGEVFRVNSDRIDRYKGAVCGYVALMTQRVGQAVPEVVNF